MLNCQGNESQLRESLSQLHELDLSNNLLSSWLILRQLGTALPRLACLNLTQNIMAMPTPEALATAPPNPALRILVLNNCCLTWSQVGMRQHPSARYLCQCSVNTLDIPPVLKVVSIQASVPGLQELHLCNNNISQLSGSDSQAPMFPQLQVCAPATSGSATCYVIALPCLSTNMSLLVSAV